MRCAVDGHWSTLLSYFDQVIGQKIEKGELSALLSVKV